MLLCKQYNALENLRIGNPIYEFSILEYLELMTLTRITLYYICLQFYLIKPHWGPHYYLYIIIHRWYSVFYKSIYENQKLQNVLKCIFYNFGWPENSSIERYKISILMFTIYFLFEMLCVRVNIIYDEQTFGNNLAIISCHSYYHMLKSYNIVCK